jgi:hypothetical protein
MAACERPEPVAQPTHFTCVYKTLHRRLRHECYMSLRWRVVQKEKWENVELEARSFVVVKAAKGKLKYLRPSVCSPGVAKRTEWF